MFFAELVGTYSPDVKAENTISELNGDSFYLALPTGVVVQIRVNDADLSLVLMDGQGDDMNVISNPIGEARFKIVLSDDALVPTDPTVEYR